VRGNVLPSRANASNSNIKVHAGTEFGAISGHDGKHSKSSQLISDYSEDAPTNPRGIPRAIFIDRVEDYITDRSEVESTINSFKEMISYDKT
jgi:hypothetical protein